MRGVVRFLFGGIVNDETRVSSVDYAAAIILRHFAELLSSYECVCLLQEDEMSVIDSDLIAEAESPSFAAHCGEDLPGVEGEQRRQCLLIWHVANKLDDRK